MKTSLNQDIVEFDVCKETIISKLNNIIEEEFIYSVDNIVDMLSIQRVYIQENICAKLNNFNVDRVFKTYIKACIGNRRAFLELSQYVDVSGMTFEDFKSNNRDLVELIRASKLDSYKLSRRILISRKQLKDLLSSIFVYERSEVLKYDGVKLKDISHYSLTEGDVECIIDYGLVNQAYLKEHYGVNTELQVYRRLEKGDYNVFKKYVIKTENEKKKGLTRYLVNKDGTDEKFYEIHNKLFGYDDDDELLDM